MQFLAIVLSTVAYIVAPTSDTLFLLNLVDALFSLLFG